MARLTHKANAAGWREPSLTVQFLPRCHHCHAPHPLARKGFVGDQTICPDCGMPAAFPGKKHVEKAALTGFFGAIATVFLWIGKKLIQLAQRI